MRAPTRRRARPDRRQPARGRAGRAAVALPAGHPCLFIWLYTTVATLPVLRAGRRSSPMPSPTAATARRCSRAIDLATNTLTVGVQLFVTARLVDALRPRPRARASCPRSSPWASCFSRRRRRR
ncbi:MAG: hypothetical protein U5K43_12120 [Halofilum sp. (in: g-proteobacteria)]|nr:hypothetical protein [Halofilum sp. (in: g-proteobacteria)]